MGIMGVNPRVFLVGITLPSIHQVSTGTGRAAAIEGPDLLLLECHTP